MIRAFDALTLSIVTTSRKFMTIVVNAIVFPAHNKMNLRQWGCVAVVFAAIAVDSIGGGGKHHGGGGGAGSGKGEVPAKEPPSAPVSGGKPASLSGARGRTW
jgi:hypothetical protein